MFGLIGKPLGHSLSPKLHKEFGLEYSLFELEENQLGDFVKNKRAQGFNVTVPYKKTIIPFLDELDETAKEIGAVNTVVFKGEKAIGYNTDAGGMIYALNRAKISLKDKTVAILGTGGTSNTAYYVAKKLGAKKVFKVGRASEINYQNFYEIKGVEVIINTTPVGMYPNIYSTPVNLEKVDGLECVFDVVYNPLKTRLIEQAEKMNLSCANGFAMLVEQARLAENLFFGYEKIPLSETEKVLGKLYKEKTNIVLIGMAGCGKTTIGKELEKMLNMPLIDLDEEIVKKSNMTISEIFERFGEEYFRNIERQVTKEVCLKQGVIIATGGGAVCYFDNADSLKQNGKLVFIKRENVDLPTCDRPLSKKHGASALYAKRKPIYESLADFVCENDILEKTVLEIKKYYEKDISY